MQEQKNKNKTKLCKLRISSEREQWQRSISESARRLSKRQSIRVCVVHIDVLNERLKELNGYDEVMWHFITLMKKKPVLQNAAQKAPL